MTTEPNAMSRKLAALVDALAPAILRVESGRQHPATAVAWAEELAVTTHSALGDEEVAELGLADGRTVRAELVGHDPGTDLALLKAPGVGLARPAWATSADLRVGHLLLALARPGRTVRAALGIVGALGEGWRPGGGGRIERYVQADLHAPPGFAGGAVVTESAQVVGLLAPALVRGATVVLPGETLTRLVGSLLSGGTTRRGYLGLNTYPAPLPAALAGELGCESGLVVVAVQPGSPAERGGVMLGDVLLALDGQPVRHIADLLDYLDGDRVGREAAVRLLRAGQALDLHVVVGARPG